jgi:hypothetical protein
MAKSGAYSVSRKSQYQGIANTIVQLIRWRNSGNAYILDRLPTKCIYRLGGERSTQEL